jgi:hypothetical protein
MVITQSRPDFNMRAIDMERFVSAFNRKSNLRLVSPATTEAERKLLLDLSVEEYDKYPAPGRPPMRSRVNLLRTEPLPRYDQLLSKPLLSQRLVQKSPVESIEGAVIRFVATADGHVGLLHEG